MERIKGVTAMRMMEFLGRAALSSLSLRLVERKIEIILFFSISDLSIIIIVYKHWRSFLIKHRIAF